MELEPNYDDPPGRGCGGQFAFVSEGARFIDTDPLENGDDKCTYYRNLLAVEQDHFSMQLQYLINSGFLIVEFLS